MGILSSLLPTRTTDPGAAPSPHLGGNEASGIGACANVLVVAEEQVTHSSPLSVGQLAFGGPLAAARPVFQIPQGVVHTNAWGVNLRTSSLAPGHVYAVQVDGAMYAGVVVEVIGRKDSDQGELVMAPPLPALAPTEIDIVVFSRVIDTSQIIDLDVVQDNVVTNNIDGNAEVLLAGIPGDVGAGKQLVVQNIDSYKILSIVGTSIEYMKINGGPEVPQMLVRLDGPLPAAWGNAELSFWYSPVSAGKVVRIPKTSYALTDLHAGVSGLLVPDAGLAMPHDPIVLVDAKNQTITCEGTLATLDDTTTFTATKILEGTGPLIPPITAYTGLSRVTRGKTVKDELLGSGDASLPFQTFRLAKSPLTYLDGPAPQLEVYVNGEAWTRALSFYGARPTDAIYTIRHDDDHQTILTFGDGELGRRVPTGVNNVVATYRYGVGGNAPANSITTLDKPIPGVRKIFNPLPATGGRDVPSPREQQRAAVRSTMVLGRIVSMSDFEAEALQWGNVVQAKAARGWDDFAERSAVQLWFITPDAGDPSNDLRTHLAAMAEPGIPLVVTKAQPLTRDLIIEIEIAPPPTARNRRNRPCTLPLRRIRGSALAPQRGHWRSSSPQRAARGHSPSPGRARGRLDQPVRRRNASLAPNARRSLPRLPHPQPPHRLDPRRPTPARGQVSHA